MAFVQQIITTLRPFPNLNHYTKLFSNLNDILFLTLTKYFLLANELLSQLVGQLTQEKVLWVVLLGWNKQSMLLYGLYDLKLSNKYFINNQR